MQLFNAAQLLCPVRCFKPRAVEALQCGAADFWPRPSALQSCMENLPCEFPGCKGRASWCAQVTRAPTLKCIIIETHADSVVVKSNGLGPVLAAIMHPGRPFNIVKHVS
jgi:hypothetical protein